MDAPVHHPLFARVDVLDQRGGGVLSREPRLAGPQRAVTRSGVWPLVAGGCHADRDTPAAIERAGFEVQRCRRFRFCPNPVVAPASTRVVGAARRPKDAF